MYMISSQTIAVIAALLFAQCLFFSMWHGAPTTKWRFAGFAATLSSWGFLGYVLLSMPHVETTKAARAGSVASVSVPATTHS